MKRNEKITILTALEVAINKCSEYAEAAETAEDKQYLWGQADGLHNAAKMIAARPEN
jgi:hypothetical protein